MRISDCSSDACSSDLSLDLNISSPLSDFCPVSRVRFSETRSASSIAVLSNIRVTFIKWVAIYVFCLVFLPATTLLRLDERQVGQECVRKCSSRWLPYHYNKKHMNFITLIIILS